MNALLTRLSARVLLVVGKGGVGKSTASCALALQFADQQQPTHLISVDPAHSLADVLAQTFSDRVVPSDCNAGLLVEEFAAETFARAWLDDARPGLVEVLERGTYLDEADSRSFLDLSLPGVDEVMGALRLLELIDGPAKRIVVDTAPTGHLLRLLEAGALLDSWSDALEAMMQKANAVAVGLVGRAPEWSALHLIRRWRAQSRAFDAAIRGAHFVVMTRGDVVVESETTRLVAGLGTRGLPVRAVIANRRGSTRADWFVPSVESATGCRGLRAWIEAVEPAARPPAQPPSVRPVAAPDRAPQSAVFDGLPLLNQSLILVAGKGGVGKSTVASAIAVAKADVQRTCLVSTDPAGSLADVFGSPVLTETTPLLPRLDAWQLAADQQFERLRVRYKDDVHRVFEKLGLDQAAHLDRAVIDRLWNLAPPGLDEIIALTELLAAAEGCPSVVLDSAPTAHFVRLIQLPEISVEWAHALMRLLLKYGVAGALEDFTTEILGFARRTRELQARLTTPGQAAAVVVTLDEPVVWSETLRLHETLKRAKIPVAALVINRADAGPFRGHPPVDSTVRLIRAPNLDTPPIGADALRAYIRRWEVLT